MAEENQLIKEPQASQPPSRAQPVQQITKQPQQIMKEPQRVTTKNPKKVEAGKRLADSNCEKREANKRGKSEASGVNQYYGIGARSSSGSYRWPWLLHLLVQERRATTMK